MRRLLLTFLIALVPATADAATVRLVVNEGGSDRRSTGSATMFFTAAAGEVNDVQVTERGTALRITDVVPVQAAGDYCTAVDQHTVECDHASWANLSLADGDDRLRCEDFCIVDGGDGDDRLGVGAGGGSLRADGGGGADVLHGGNLQDELRGGPGADELVGGASYDLLEGDEASPPYSPDRLDGGDGIDRALYSRSTPVDVAVGVGGGAAGEGDVLTGVEALQGGAAADVLTGDDGPNDLDGGGGDDRLTGLGGDDRLAGGSGRELLDGGDGDDLLIGERGPDRYVGGAGDDRLLVAGYPRVQRRPQAALDCGPGDDLVAGPHARDRLGSACETVEIDGQRLTRLPGALAFRVRYSADYMSCPGRLIAVQGRRELSRRFRTHRVSILRFPGFTDPVMTVKVTPCWPGGDRRRERTMGRFRVRG